MMKLNLIITRSIRICLSILVCLALLVNSQPSAEAISGYNTSYPLYGLEEIPLPDNFNTTTYKQVVETSDQLWIAGGSQLESENYAGGVWNWTGNEWVKFRNATGTCGYRTWAMFNDTHHFFDEAGYGGKRVFTNDTGQNFYETAEHSLLGKAVYKLPHNESFVLVHWGDSSVWISENLMDWRLYKNITQWWIDVGLPKPDAFLPHMTCGVSQNFRRLYVNYEIKIDGVANHTTIFQNLDTGAWSLLNYTGSDELEPPRDRRCAGTTFCTLAETSQVVVHGDTDRDAGELKFINVTREDRWYLVDALQDKSIKRGWVACGQTPQLVARNDIIYAAYSVSCSPTHQPDARYGIRISPDHGVTWGDLIERRIYDGVEREWIGFNIWEGTRHLYIFDSTHGRLYRMSYLTIDEAWAVLNNKYVSRNGSSVIFEKIISNQTKDKIDFSQYGDLSGATVKLIGASYYNKHPEPQNSGFEWGNASGYGGVHISRLQVEHDPAQAYDGEYFGNFTSTGAGWHFLETDKTDWKGGIDSKGVVASLYIKWNGTGDNQIVKMGVYQYNASKSPRYWSSKGEVDYDITKSWQRINMTMCGLKKGYGQIYVRLRTYLTTPGESFFTDAWLIEECDGRIQGMPPGRKRENVYIQSLYFKDELKTKNPSAVINGQTFFHSGILENGTETSAQSITLPQTGIINISSINVQGSGLVRVKIQATAGLIAEGIFLREFTNNIYIGHYYNSSYTFSADNQIVTFSDPFANIVSAGLSGSVLTFVVSAESGRTSDTKVYCGDRGEPVTVLGATSWNYDSETGIATINVVHTGAKEIIVHFRDIPDIVLTNVTTSKTVVGQGYPMLINATIQNNGTFTETFDLTAFANTTIIETQETTLAGGGSTTVIFVWNTTGFAKGNYTISAHATPLPGELDTDDNTYTDDTVLVTIAGDVNGDGLVDIFDLSIVALAYGSFEGDPDYNPEADITTDGLVDARDLAVVTIRYGETDC